jgi:Protein of unknown function (DUF2721)
MIDGANTDAIAQTIQTAIAPVFLLAGISGILNVISTRLSRSVDRSRVLEQLHPGSTGKEHERHVEELRNIDRRITLANRATSLCVASALSICLVIILLFVSQMAEFPMGDGVALLFVLSMFLLAGGLVCFLSEIRIAVKSVWVRKELLERDR